MARKNAGKDRLPTVADVAKAAGVSPMTVSRVVNGETNVREATRERVREAVERLGYVPNQAARSLAAGKACRISLLHSNPSASFLSELLLGCMGQCSADNAQLVIEDCERSFRAEEIRARLTAPRADAVIMPPPLCDDPDLIAMLDRAGVPMAQIAPGSPHSGAISIGIDNEAAVRDLVRHLAGLGHRRIGFVVGNPNQAASALRRRGFEQGLREAGLALEPDWVEQGDFTYRSGLEAGSRILARPDRPSAVIASNDDMAAGVVAAAHRHQLDVPRDVSVCGFDDTAMATTTWPELTTIRQPIREMARCATERLIAAVRSRQGPDALPLTLDYELITRGSTAPPNL